MGRVWMRGTGTPVLVLALVAAVVAGIAGGLGQGAARQTGTFDPASFAVDFQPIAGGFERPVFLADPADGSGRLFVVEQPGAIRVVRDGEVQAEPFLDITDRVNADGSEQGLLSMAFDPDFARNGRFYVGYTGEPMTNEVARFTISADDPDRADPDSETTLLEIEDPYGNHNGGLVMFGPDGYLYVGLGDGGSGGDPENNGQNPGTLLGSILRIDVTGEADAELPYAIPGDNPLLDDPNARPEIWAYGLRNPWRFSFDRETGDLWVADVGQNAYEEVNFQPAGSPGGENYGWNLMEGAHCFPEGTECVTDGLVLPVAEYGRDAGYSITGGYVYRGESAPSLTGVYLFADFGSGLLWGMQRLDDGAVISADPIDTGLAISSFAEDAAGELYITAFDGTVYQIVEAA